MLKATITTIKNRYEPEYLDIRISLSCKGKRKLVYSGHKVKATQWDNKKKRLKKAGSLEVINLNQRLDYYEALAAIINNEIKAPYSVLFDEYLYRIGKIGKAPVKGFMLLLERYIQAHQRSYNKTTLASYTMLRNLLELYEGEESFSPTEQGVRRFVDHLIREKPDRAGSSIKLLVGKINAVLRYYEHPTVPVKKAIRGLNMRKANTAAWIPSPEEMARIVGVGQSLLPTEDRNLCDFFLFLYETGIRFNEAVKLTWGNVDEMFDVQAGKIRVLEYTLSKGRFRERASNKIFLPETAYNIIQKYKGELGPVSVKASQNRYNNPAPLLPCPKSNVHGNAVLKNLLKLAGIDHMVRVKNPAARPDVDSQYIEMPVYEHFTMHHFRHCKVANLRAQGFSEAHIAQHIGDNVMTLLNHYPDLDSTQAVIEMAKKIKAG